MKYYVVVYGCQMNTSDAERVSAVLEKINYKKTSNINEADLIVIAMCSVRQSAVNRVHGFVQKFKEMRRTRPGLKTILTGCILKKDRRKFANGFDYIVDIKDIKNLPKILGKKSLNNTDNYLDIVPKYSSKFSANVPIMTGCNNFCSYCVVPYVREREISRPAKEIISEIKNLIKNKHKEIWLLGQNVNSYKDENVSFPKLLRMINDIPGSFWIRFTSSHPKDFNSEVIDALAVGQKITPYLNLPIQSGDNKVLKLMNRHYTVKDYKNKINALRKKIPDICVSTDIIVGFPGETKKQFENTAQLFRDIKYDMAYINKYSPRAGTAAAKLKDNVSIIEKKRREKVLTGILKQTALEKNKKFLGKKSTVLIDSNSGDNWFGKNEHYKTVQVKSDKNLLGKFVKVKITEAMIWALKGKIIK
jgi:tRNA-2-methylthio-N6-dimethylallyladenosine synthase